MASLSPPRPALSRNLSGILLALFGSAILSINDMAVKALSGQFPLHEVVLIRSIVGMTFLATLVLVTRGPGAFSGLLKTTHPRLHLARVMCNIFSNISYFLAIAALPLADGVAIFFVAPLLVTALSVPILGEKVGPRRWAAVGVGLLGVIVMTRPGQEGFDPAAILCLISAALYALMLILTRLIGRDDSAITMSAYTQIGFFTVSILMGLVVGDGRFGHSDNASMAFLLRAWHWPAPGDWLVLVLSGLAVSVGGLMISQAYRLCEAGLVAPFEYSSLPMAVMWGLVIFGTWPDRTAWTGIALIVGAGLYTLWRETRVRRAT